MKTKLVIFGITGDLSTRKLIPALSQIIETGNFEDLSIIGVSRRQPDQFQLLGEHHEQLNGTTTIFSMDLTQASEYVRLKEYIELGDDEQAIFYLSVPPESMAQIVELLGQAGLNTPNVKLMLEKPFGTDLTSAHEMIDHVAAYYQESQIYRIDHYLAKEMSQNIVAFRGGNALFDHVWSAQAIEKIEVVAYEQIGIEGRADFYEQTGALRDVLQGHLMQLLSLILMDIPHDFDWSEAATYRAQALADVRPADPAKSQRGQYASYRDEVKNPSSMTETFVRLELESTDPRWEGVPLILATGKGLNEKTTEVRVHFRKSHEAQTNCLTFRIQPSEGVEIDLFVKKPGYDREFETKTLSFEYDKNTRLPDAYEQVIVDAIASRKSLFAGSAEVLRAWEIVKPVQDRWKTRSDDLIRYDSGANPVNIA